jgi:hypothetical protein
VTRIVGPRGVPDVGGAPLTVSVFGLGKASIRPITDVDTTAADMLADLDEELNAAGISLVFAELKDPVREKLERYQLIGPLDPDHFLPTLDAAVDAFRAKTGAEWTEPVAATADEEG